jgi:chromosome segregation ATPase
MTDVTELEQRIAAALDRVESGLAALSGGGAQPSDAEEVASLREALEAERAVNAQLEARVQAIREKQERLVGTLEAEVGRLRREMHRQEAEVARLKRVNAQLRQNNRALREANRKGVGDAALINTAMEAELDALREVRDADRAELDAIIGELRPLVEGGADA